MFSLAASTNKAMATICLVAMLTATIQLQHGGMCLAQGSDWGYMKPRGIIRCGGGSTLRAQNKCDLAATALNGLAGVAGVECGDGEGYTSKYDLRIVRNNCDQAAAALNGLAGVTGAGVECSDFIDHLGHHNVDFLQVHEIEECNEVASALSNLIAPVFETSVFYSFYMAAAPITAVASLGSGYYAYNYLGGSNNAWYKSILFGLFVGFRFFDLMSDWAMFAISLKTYHEGQPLRDANLAFSIIGSLLLILDLKTMRERADHWFRIEDDNESLKSVGWGMLLIVFLEDLPQLIITIIYFHAMPEDREFTGDPIAVTSVVLSGISMFINGFIGFRSLCQSRGRGGTEC